MEKLIDELCYLTNEQLGAICKMISAYKNGMDYEDPNDENLKRFFIMSVKPRVDKILKERKRNERRRKNGK